MLFAQPQPPGILVLTGPPGAGKTTVAALVAASFERSVHLVADQCFHWVASGFVAPWRPEADQQNATVVEAVAASAARFAAGGYQVVVDGIVGPWFVDRFLAAVPGVTPVAYAVLRPGPAVALARALGRTGERDLRRSGPVEAMIGAFADLGTYEPHVVDSSGLTAEETAAEVLARLGARTLHLRGAPGR